MLVTPPIALDPHFVARELGGDVCERNVLAPGRGHSRGDRSLSVKIDPAAPEGFVVYSFAGDAPIACREHVRSALGLGAWEQPPPSPRCSRSKAEPNDTTSCSAFALRIWKEAGDPTGSVVDQYLASRK